MLNVGVLLMYARTLWLTTCQARRPPGENEAVPDLCLRQVL